MTAMTSSLGHGSSLPADQPVEELALEREVATDEVVVLELLRSRLALASILKKLGLEDEAATMESNANGLLYPPDVGAGAEIAPAPQP